MQRIHQVMSFKCSTQNVQNVTETRIICESDILFCLNVKEKKEKHRDKNSVHRWIKHINYFTWKQMCSDKHSPHEAGGCLDRKSVV